jgi:hypothetical protein
MNRTELLAMFPHASEEFIAENTKPKPVKDMTKAEREKAADQMDKQLASAEAWNNSRESELQRDCELWLRHRGYCPMSANYAESEHRQRMFAGWYGHLNNAVCNPLMADLMIYDAAMRHCLMIELKIRSHYQPGQREMIALGCWKEARTFEVVTELVKEWEKEIGR